MNEIEAMKANVDLMHGRLNAVEATLHALLRMHSQPREALVAALTEASLRVEIGADTWPVSDRTIAATKDALRGLLSAARNDS